MTYQDRCHVDCDTLFERVAFWSKGGNKSKCDTLVAVGTRFGTLRVYNVATGALVGDTRCSNDWIYCVAFAPDGQTVATGSQDSIAIYSVEQQLVLRIIQSRFAIYSLVFSPDGRKLVSGSCNRFTVADLDAQQQIKCSVSESIIYGIAYAPNGKTLACGLHNGEIRLFDAETNVQLFQKQAHNHPVKYLTFSPDDSKLLASAACESGVWIWDVKLGAALQLLSRRTEYIVHIAFSSNGKLFLSCAPYGDVAIWSTRDFKSQTRVINGLQPTRALENNRSEIRGLSFFNNNSHMVFLTQNNSLRIKWLLEYRLLVQIVIPCLKISLAPYVLLEVVNFLLAKKNACRFDCEEDFLHTEKVYCIERLRALSSNHHRCDRHTV